MEVNWNQGRNETHYEDKFMGKLRMTFDHMQCFQMSN